MSESRASRFTLYAAWGIIALGGVLRLRQYLANRSLWHDEAMLALNILERDFLGLLKPLDYEQGAPLGFLQLEKLISKLLGEGELSLRLLPLLAGLASLVLFYLVLKRILSPAGTITALALFAISPTLVYYSSELKQYSSDVFIALLLLWLALTPLPQDHSFRSFGMPGGGWPLFLAGFVAIWFSHPALFVLAAIGSVMLLENILQRNRAGILSTLATDAGWLASVSGVYLVSLRTLTKDDFLIGYWNEYFMPLPPSPGWILSMTKTLFSNPGGLEVSGWVLLAASTLGAGLLVWRRPKDAGRLILPFFFALAASALKFYPYAGRMMLFSIPLLFALLGACVDLFSGLALRPKFLSALVALAAAGWMLYNPLFTSAERLIAPRLPEHMREAVLAIKSQYREGDGIFVYGWAVPAYRYYARRLDVNFPVMEGTMRPPTRQQLLDEVDALTGKPRVWVLFSHVYQDGDFDEQQFILAHLDLVGKRRREVPVEGASLFLYLYDLGLKP
jgi:hypothetical protein